MALLAVAANVAPAAHSERSDAWRLALGGRRSLLQGEHSGPLDFIRSMHAHVFPSGSAAASVADPKRSAPVEDAGAGGQGQGAVEPTQVVPMAPAGSMGENSAKRHWLEVRAEWGRDTCMTQRSKQRQKLHNQPTAAEAAVAGATCPPLRFLLVTDDFHQDGYGLMLIKLQRLLGLGCLTERTLLLPPATFSALAGLVDLQALRSAGYCLESSKRDLWREGAVALVAQYRKAGVTGLPDASAFATPALAPTFQPGMPLGHVARVMNSGSLGTAPIASISAAHALSTCTAWREENAFYRVLKPPQDVLQEMQYFQYYWMHASHSHYGKEVPPGTLLPTGTWHKLAKKIGLGKPGSGHFLSVSPALMEEECAYVARSYFHDSTTYGHVPEHVAAACWPTLNTLLGVQRAVLGHPGQPMFVPSEQSQWRMEINLQLLNETDAERFKHSVALSYEPLSTLQWERRKQEQNVATDLYNQCVKQRKHDPASVQSGGCEAQRDSKAPNLDKALLERVAPFVNFWLLTVGEAFLGSAADPQSVAVANIRAAQRVEGAVLQWGGAAPGVDVSGKPASHHWQLLKHAPPHVQHPVGEDYWSCERYCYWCGPDQRSRC
eukprot:jgi/Tetstr1/440876/TSEL_029149.t2